VLQALAVAEAAAEAAAAEAAAAAAAAAEAGEEAAAAEGEGEAEAEPEPTGPTAASVYSALKDGMAAVRAAVEVSLLCTQPALQSAFPTDANLPMPLPSRLICVVRDVCRQARCRHRSLNQRKEARNKYRVSH
jgi:hypothetical protein